LSPTPSMRFTSDFRSSPPPPTNSKVQRDCIKLFPLFPSPPICYQASFVSIFDPPSFHGADEFRTASFFLPSPPLSLRCPPFCQFFFPPREIGRRDRLNFFLAPLGLLGQYSPTSHLTKLFFYRPQSQGTLLFFPR